MSDYLNLTAELEEAETGGESCLDDLSCLSESEHHALVASVTNDFKQWKQSRERLESKWQECWQAYLCDAQTMYTTSDPSSSDRSRVVRPVLYEAVEAIQANLLNALFPSDERFFSVTGKREHDHHNAVIIEEFLRNKLEHLGFVEKYGLFLKQAIITGNSVAAVPWQRKTRQRKTYRPVEMMGVTIGTEKVTVEELVYNGPDFEVLDIFEFMIDPDEPDFEKAKVIRRVERPLDYVLNNELYRNTDGLTAYRDDWDPGKKHHRRRAFGIQESALENTSNRKNQVVLMESWGDFSIEGKQYENYVCVVANGQRVIRFEPNPYDHGGKPFVFTSFIPVPNEVYGIGAIEKSLGLQHAINTLTNQKLDIINISINNPFTYLINDDVFDPNTVVTKPGALIPVKDHDTLRPIQYLNNFTVAFNEIADLKAEIQEATGAIKFFTGADSPGSYNRTATEVAALVTGGSQKFNNFIAHLENASLEPFLMMAFENAKQFMKEPEYIRFYEKDGSLAFVEILPSILQLSDCTFKVEGSQAGIHKGQELEALVTFVRMVQEIPGLADQMNIMPLVKKIYRRLGFKDEEDVFQF